MPFNPQVCFPLCDIDLRLLAVLIPGYRSSSVYDENVGIDTKTKSLDSLIRKIFVIEWFHLISMIIRSSTQNSMNNKLLEILTVEIVSIDTKTKYLESLNRNIFAIEWFHLIRMLIRSITQKAMDKKLASGSFLVLNTHILHFHNKPLQYSTFLGSPFAK